MVENRKSDNVFWRTYWDFNMRSARVIQLVLLNVIYKHKRFVAQLASH